MDDSEAEYEGTDHYGQQQYYSDEETFYDTGDPGKNRFLLETDSRDGVNYSTEEDRRHRPKQIRYSYDETNFNTGADDVNIYGSQERHDHDENHFKTEDSHHGDTTRSKGNACRHFSLFFSLACKANKKKNDRALIEQRLARSAVPVHSLLVSFLPLND